LPADTDNMLHDLLQELAGYVTNMYVPAYEERMRFLFPQIRALAEGNDLVQQMVESAEEYMEHAVSFYHRRTELGVQTEEGEADRDPELLELARAKMEATRRWSRLWQQYRESHPTDKW
jgi:fumarate hydratase class II